MLRRYLNATTITWALLHIIMVLVGLLVMHWQIINQQIGVELAAGLGVSIMSTGVVGLILFLYVVLSDTTRSRLKALNEAGLDAVFSFRSVRMKSEYDRRLADAKRIDVVGYGLGSFLEDYASEFGKWSKQAKVRLVVVNPKVSKGTTSFADLRDIEEGRNPGKTTADVSRLIRTIQADRKIDRSNFEVRLMDAIPSINVMIIDDEIFWGPYLLATQSRNTFTMTVRRGGYMFEALEGHFKKLWDTYTTPPSEAK